MTYSKQTWANGVAGGTPVSAARLTHMEDGIEAANFGIEGVFNVFAYGAVGDGSTNDRDAFQDALDAAFAAGGGTVLVPGGYTYSLASRIIIREGTTLSAYGATVVRATPNFSFVRNFDSVADSFAGYSGNSNIVVEGGTWDGNSVGAVATSGNVFTFAHCENITVRDITVLDVSSAHAVEFNGVKRGLIVNCRAFGMTTVSTNSEAFQLDVSGSASAVCLPYDNTPCVDIVIDGCECGPSASLGGWGRLVGSHTAYAGVWHDGIRVVNCLARDTIEHGIRPYQWNHVVIADNVVIDPGSIGIQARPGDPLGAGAGSNTITDYTITGNVVTSSTGDGIQIFGLSDSVAAEGIVVANNRIEGAGGEGIQVNFAPGIVISGNHVKSASGIGIYTSGVDSAAITGNVVRSSGSHGITIADGDFISISDNIVSTAGGYGILLSPNAANCSVRSNVVSAATSGGLRASSASNYSSFISNTVRLGGLSPFSGSAISVTSGCTGVTHSANDFYGHSAAGVSDAGIFAAVPADEGVVVLAADVTNNNASANTIADVTGLSVPVVAGTYWFRFFIHYTAAATTTGSRWAVNGPTSTALRYESRWSLTTTTETLNHGVNAYDSPAAANVSSAATASNTALIEGFATFSASGTLIARFASEVSASAIVAKAGSILEYKRVG